MSSQAAVHAPDRSYSFLIFSYTSPSYLHTHSGVQIPLLIQLSQILLYFQIPMFLAPTSLKEIPSHTE